MKPPKRKPYIPPSYEDQLKDLHRYSGKSMNWNPADEGPYDRVEGKDMLVDKKDAPPKRKAQKLAKGGVVKRRSK